MSQTESVVQIKAKKKKEKKKTVKKSLITIFLNQCVFK